MRLVLDTNVFANKEFCDWLISKTEATKMLPAVAYTELLYHYLKRDKTKDFTDRFLEVRGIEIPHFDAEVASKAAQEATKEWNFREKFRDYAIGATALVHDARLVTRNMKDFGWMPEDKVVSPEDLMK